MAHLFSNQKIQVLASTLLQEDCVFLGNCASIVSCVCKMRMMLSCLSPRDNESQTKSCNGKTPRKCVICFVKAMSYSLKEGAAGYIKLSAKYIIVSRSLKSKTIYRQEDKSSLQMLLYLGEMVKSGHKISVKILEM